MVDLRMRRRFPSQSTASSSSFCYSCRQALLKASYLSIVFFVLLSQWETEKAATISSRSDKFRTRSSRVSNSNFDEYEYKYKYEQSLQSLIRSSAFDSHLYHSFHFPYSEWECQPRKVHLAPQSNVDPVTGKVNITVSFTLAYNQNRHNNNNNNNNSVPDDEINDVCRSVKVSVVFGRGFFAEGRVETETTGYGDRTTGNNLNDMVGQNKNNNTSINDEVVQFQHYTSPVTGEDYTSDYIHHIVLPNLVAGRKRYWYRIEVRRPFHDPSKDRQQQSTYNSNNPPFFFFPPSMNNGNPLIAGVTQQRTLYRSLRGSLQTVGETPIYHFHTPPLYHQPTSLALVGDLGQTENSTKTMYHIYRAMIADMTNNNNNNNNMMPPVTALLIAGDLSYADGDPHRWESWLEVMEPLLRALPFVSATGNHEIECNNITNEVFVPYESYFRNPNRLMGADRAAPTNEYRKTLWRSQCNAPSAFLGHYNYGNAFYQFTHGLVHVIVLNSYTSSVVGSVQYNWLDNVALANVDRALTPWLLVMFHCPLYTTFKGHESEINPTLMLSNMEDLFLQNHVNLIVSGHDHAYMRTKPMHDGHSTTMVWSNSSSSSSTTASGDGGAPVFWTLGAGGNREQHSKGYIHDTPEEWVAKRDIDEYGYGHLFVQNATHARLQWVRDGTTIKGIHDDVWMENYYYL